MVKAAKEEWVLEESWLNMVKAMAMTMSTDNSILDSWTPIDVNIVIYAYQREDVSGFLRLAEAIHSAPAIQMSIAG
jgi:hypothetical protein